MKSTMTDKYFVILVLNKLTSEYDNQVWKSELVVTSDPLTIDEVRDDLSLHYECLAQKSRHEDSVTKKMRKPLQEEEEGSCSKAVAASVARGATKEHSAVALCWKMSSLWHSWPKKQDCRKKKKNKKEEAEGTTIKNCNV
jgi:hypothetical protein